MWFRTEVHWNINVRGCPVVHMIFNEWIEDTMSGHDPAKRSTHMDMCECFLNSVPLSCHKETFYRVWLLYGPSWRVPLHAKALDVPHIARKYNIAKKLRNMVAKDGVIYAQAIRNLDKKIKYTDGEMEMILAQVNVQNALITCQNDKTCRKKVIWY